MRFQKNDVPKSVFKKMTFATWSITNIIPVYIALGGVDLKILWNVCLMFKSSKASFTRHVCSKKIE